MIPKKRLQCPAEIMSSWELIDKNKVHPSCQIVHICDILIQNVCVRL